MACSKAPRWGWGGQQYFVLRQDLPQPLKKALDVRVVFASLDGVERLAQVGLGWGGDAEVRQQPAQGGGRWLHSAGVPRGR